ncbi:MAG: hypothetical protein M1818_004351 [Claussenomyces sp. TS43310]|nr:MAG: hypothetical protein M1818_004351 [Claussenomyces sp. TS43310]
MAVNDYTSAVFIKRQGWRPSYILDAMITVADPVKTTTIVQKIPEFSSIGLLGSLPLELLHEILNSLDFLSLSYLARVSHGGRAAVKSLPAYRDLVKYASPALTALARTKLITFHSAACIHAALRSEDCVSCQQFAPSLFLPTCERCCFDCLQELSNFKVITSEQAGILFGVSPKDLCRIPSMTNIPGTYYWETHEEEGIRLFSWKQSKELGVAIHGSEEAMEEFAMQNMEKTPGALFHLEIDKFCGMASTFFPALRPENVLENGVWSLGCRRYLKQWCKTNDPDCDKRRFDAGVLPLEFYERSELRARTLPQFIEHIRQCEKAEGLLEQFEESGQCDGWWET